MIANANLTAGLNEFFWLEWYQRFFQLNTMQARERSRSSGGPLQMDLSRYPKNW
jgi:hypothetical protein